MDGTYQFKPENELEKTVMASDVFREALPWGKVRNNHPEGNLGTHISHILDYIDRMDWVDYRSDLRLLALLHDIGKPHVSHKQPSHNQLSAEIASRFLSDESLIELIRYSDKQFSFFKQSKGRKGIKEDKFVTLYGALNLPLLIRFNYADGCDRSVESVMWFEDTLQKFKLIEVPLYQQDPNILRNNNYHRKANF